MTTTLSSPPLDRAAAAPRHVPPRAGSRSHIVLIPSYNSGPLLARTVTAARAQWAPVWIVIDGSTDGSAAAAETLAARDPAVRVLRLATNQGKGAAVRHGALAAYREGFTHALVMDADLQHPADLIPAFMTLSAAEPDALVMGRPVFGRDAPWVRVVFRRLCNWLAAAETLRDAGDTLFGFRVYPLVPLLAAMQHTRFMRRFDFDPEAVVRLAWAGTALRHVPAPVRYLAPAEGGVSHFRYARDNLVLCFMHLRLARAALLRLCDRAAAGAHDRA